MYRARADGKLARVAASLRMNALLCSVLSCATGFVLSASAERPPHDVATISGSRIGAQYVFDALCAFFLRAELITDANMKRETGRKAQLGNITAGKAVASLVRTALGPKAMLKMLLSASGGIVITADGNAILREIETSHPAAKSIIELSRVQDEEVGDGTTSVVVLTGEMLYAAEACLVQRNLHPTEIIRAYQRGLEDILAHVNTIAWKVDVNNRAEMSKIVEACLGTKFTNRWSKVMVTLSLDAVAMVATEKDGRREVDTKRFVRIEKLPGGDIDDSTVLRGVMFNKDVTHAKMRRRIEKPRILLLDCTLEYKKGESATSAEISKEGEFEELLRQEEEQIQRMCADIIKFKPDLVITEKGMSDLCQHLFVKHNISGLRRLKKTDTNRIARATGATIVNRTDEIKESDIGTGAGLFEVQKIGDEYASKFAYCFLLRFRLNDDLKYFRSTNRRCQCGELLPDSVVLNVLFPALSLLLTHMPLCVGTTATSPTARIPRHAPSFYAAPARTCLTRLSATCTTRLPLRATSTSILGSLQAAEQWR